MFRSVLSVTRSFHELCELLGKGWQGWQGYEMRLRVEKSKNSRIVEALQLVKLHLYKQIVGCKDLCRPGMNSTEMPSP